MNKQSRPQACPFAILVSSVAITLTLTQFAIAADPKEGRFTQVIRDVRLLASKTAARPAAVNDSVSSGSAVRTGDESRAEITFADQTLTRLGANTVFSFGREAHTYDLGSGAVLMYAPEKAGEVKIRMSAATAAVSGFTAMIETHAKGWNKFIMLHGKGGISFNGVSREPCQLHDGQMIAWQPHPSQCPPVLDIDLSKLVRGKLIKGFKQPLPEMKIILTQISNQQTSPPSGGLVDPTSSDKIDQRAATDPHNNAPPPPHPPPPG
ncbi:MAG: FecR domain-containing protein [Verrucomicrobiota bacterium]